MADTDLKNGERNRERPRATLPIPGAFTSPPSSSTKYLQTSRWPPHAAPCNAPTPSLLKEKIADGPPFPRVRLFTISFLTETISHYINRQPNQQNRKPKEKRKNVCNA
jgi:hypothetical protein